MSSLESIYKKMASLEPGGAGKLHEAAHSAEPLPRAVAHELNNILTIIQGYADRLLLKHKENPALQPQLQLISESARRAVALVREAMPPDANSPLRQNPPSPPPA